MQKAIADRLYDFPQSKNQFTRQVRIAGADTLMHAVQSRGIIGCMCGRYAIGPNGELFDVLTSYSEHGRSMPSPFVRIWPALKALPWNGDVRPGSSVPVAMDLRGELKSVLWWFTPAWAKDPKAARKATTFNARLDTVSTAPTFRNAWKAGRRVLIPMLGYYEWVPIEGSKTKQRYYIEPPNGGYIWAAGLWEHWEPKQDGLPFDSCTMITTDQHPDVPIHDRAPVFIPDALAADWFAADSMGAMELLLAADRLPLKLRAVGGPIEPTGPQTATAGTAPDLFG